MNKWWKKEQPEPKVLAEVNFETDTPPGGSAFQDQGDAPKMVAAPDRKPNGKCPSCGHRLENVG